MSKAIKVVRKLLVDDATIGGVVGNRVFPADGVPAGLVSDYIVLTRLSDRANGDSMNSNTVDERVAVIQVEIVSRTYANAAAVGAAMPGAIDGNSRTVDGVDVIESQCDDEADSPDGPIDLDEFEAFVQTVDVNVAYRP